MRTIACLALLAACRTPPAPLPVPPPLVEAEVEEPHPAGPPSQPGKLLATVGDTAVLALDAPRFADLTREERLLAYWLSRAAAEGDAIAWDQGYRHNLEVVRLLRGILQKPQAVQPALLARVRDYARTLYLHHGLHDPDTERKELPPFTPAELRQAALAAQAAGAELGAKNVPLEFTLRALEGPLFDPRVDAVRAQKAPPPGEDLLLASAVNLYQGVSVKDLANFSERYQLNSRLVKEAGKVTEQIERAASPGLHSERMSRAAAALEEALPHASTAAQRQAIEQLAAWFRSGDAERWRDFEREWAKDAPGVDFILGFVETYADPRGLKALFEGFVGIEDPPRSAALKALAARAQDFEQAMPFAPEWKRPQVRTPLASALSVVAATGENRPQSFSGVNLPNDQQERERFGSKSFLLPGLDDAEAEVRTLPLLKELAPAAWTAEITRCFARLEFAEVALHEIVGHASGAVSPALGKDPSEVLQPNYNTLEEARADLVAHFHATEPLVRDAGLLDERCQRAYPHFVTAEWFATTADVRDGDRIEEDHHRAAQLMIWWFTGKGAIAERHQDGKRSLVVTDAALWHAAASELLALLQEIKATGNAPRLRELVEKHATRLDPAWRDEIVQRLESLGLPRRVAALAPRLMPVLADGKVIDAQAAPVDDLDAQILRDWASY